MVATSAHSKAFDAELVAINAVKGPANVSAVISLFGLYDFTKLQAQSEWLIGGSNANLTQVSPCLYGSEEILPRQETRHF